MAKAWLPAFGECRFRRTFTPYGHRRKWLGQEPREGRCDMKKQLLVTAPLLFTALGLSSPVFAQYSGSCAIDPGTVQKLQSKLASVVTQNNGGLFSPNRMWSAVVDRSGVLCSVISSSSDAWPGSRSIAIAKASTAKRLQQQ
jgi:hypothetical protein